MMCRLEERAREAASIAVEPSILMDASRQATPAGSDGEYPLAGASPVNPAARWDPSRSPLSRGAEDALAVVVATAVDSAEEAQRQAGTSAGVPAGAAGASAVAGDVRACPIVLGEESAETATAAGEEKGDPAAPAARAADCADTSPSRSIPAEESREAASSREAGSALVVASGDAEPSDAFLEAMVREESWLQTVRGGGPSLRFDDAALDTARAAIDAVRAQADSHIQAIG